MPLRPPVRNYSRTTTIDAGCAPIHARSRSSVCICWAFVFREPRKDTSTSSSPICVTTTFVSNARNAFRRPSSAGSDSFTRRTFPPSLPEHRQAEAGRASLLRGSPVLLDQVARHLLGALRSLDVSLGGLDDRALHENVEGARELVGVTQTGLLGERAQDRADVLQLLGARTPDRMLRVGRLEHHLDERATFEVAAVEPLVEEVEDREQTPFRGRAALARLGLDPPVRPDRLPLAEEGEHEV